MKGLFDFSKVADKLDPITALVFSWQKIEFELWIALLDEVQARFDTDVCQLWFPLYLVLQQGCYEDTENCTDSTRNYTATPVKMTCRVWRSSFVLPALVNSKGTFNLFMPSMATSAHGLVS
ncbi:hypothetical protein HanXRQr2_Chr16g0741531 [Helianthus annuus]|uniref:Uncharacterized protein n=1 Tax=Helianthus annuus TaxID=4232 RepID=A0A9K3GXQ5_HELAN|nr:hypothetical protein HanXRQr2_Chr16g0741531 [Helianthus annuus]